MKSKLNTLQSVYLYYEQATAGLSLILGEPHLMPSFNYPESTGLSLLVTVKGGTSVKRHQI